MAPLEWGDSTALAALRPPFDVVLGSDVIYHADGHDVLAETLSALSGPDTVVLWATPDGSPTSQRWGKRVGMGGKVQTRSSAAFRFMNIQFLTGYWFLYSAVLPTNGGARLGDCGCER